jgi:Ser/Thr protein kinase RdoA (MazF antagonist)
VREALDDIESAIAYVDASGVNSHDRIQTFLHNDLNAGNVLFDEKGEVRALIDLDQASPGPAVWDIGNTLASFATQLYKENPSTDIEPYVHTFIRNYHAANPLPLKEYSLILAATQRWDLMRILRNIRRHLYEHNRHSALYSKTGARLIPRLRWAPKAVDFITDEWIEDAIK